MSKPEPVNVSEFLDVLLKIKEEYDKAVSKHPNFAYSLTHGLALINEELGELAMEINDAIADTQAGCENPNRMQNIRTEIAHIAVTAIRMMVNANYLPLR